MRHILSAAACTLCIIAALLSLPPTGAPHAELLAQSPGDRAAVETSAEGEFVERGPRALVSPEEVDVEVAGQIVSADDASETDSGVADLAAVGPITNSLSAIEVEDLLESLDFDDVEVAPSTTTTTSTTTTSTTSTTTTTDAPTSTTAAPTVAASAPASDGGVIVTSTGVVLPVIGPASAGGFRALTPCGNEVTLDSGDRVTTVDFVIDPGHGGSESGAVGQSGATEKGLNLRIAEITQWYLEEAGYSVLLTRTTDIRLPLRSRAEIANALQPQAFVSIHHNGGATRPQSTPGTEIFVDGGNPEASRLGGILFEELVDAFDDYEADWVGTWRNGVGTRFNSSGEDLYGIHRFTPGVPSVITEPGYLSNPSEEALFVDNDVQWAHGKAIADGLIRWATTGDAGSGYLDDFVDDSSSGTGGFDGCQDPAL